MPTPCKLIFYKKATHIRTRQPFKYSQVSKQCQSIKFSIKLNLQSQDN